MLADKFFKFIGPEKMKCHILQIIDFAIYIVDQ